MKVYNKDFMDMVHMVPSYISNIYYDIIAQNKCKVPRKASVLKVFKDNLVSYGGHNYKDLTEGQQKLLLSVAEDAYEGIRG